MDYIQLGTAGVALVAGAGGLVGYFRANVSKATIALYKEDNEALRKRLDTVEDQNRANESEIKALRSAKDYLTSVVTQAEGIAELKNGQAAMRKRLEEIALAVGA